MRGVQWPAIHRTGTSVYILSKLISVPFFFFVDCRVRVRVSSRVRDSVSFIFYCIFFFPMYVKRLKITTRSTVPCWCSGVVFVSCLLSQELTGSNPAVRVIIFFTSVFQLLFTSFL